MDVSKSDGLVEGFGDILLSLYAFAKSIELHMFNIDFTLWDIFLAGVVVGLLAFIWHGLTD